MHGPSFWSHRGIVDAAARQAIEPDYAAAPVSKGPPASAHQGQLVLGQTLPALLAQACQTIPNPQALNQWHHHQWHSLANTALQQDAEVIALGLQGLGLQYGDRLPLVMQSDSTFCRVDWGCLLAGIVDVPIDLTQTIENIFFILRHTQAQAMVVSNVDLLQQLSPYLWQAPTLTQMIVAEVPEDWSCIRQHLCHQGQSLPSLPVPQGCLHVPQCLGAAAETTSAWGVPPRIQLWSLEEVRVRGRQEWTEVAGNGLRRAIAPQDTATILYIASATQRPKGVVLSHENITANVIAAFSSYPHLRRGPTEVALMFLPLTHIFARVFLYGHLAYGHTVYLSDPNHLFKHLRTVRPTLMITVPRLVDKVYERLRDQGQQLRGVDRAVFDWAWTLTQRFVVGSPPQGLYALQLQLADRLVFARWRAYFGDRLTALISGGAALRAELVNGFTAAGLPVLQGYGLTETSGVVCYTRGSANRAGTVGKPIPGVDIRLASDGEILIKAPFVTAGYYRDPDETRTVLDADGWLHTGDLGSLDADGFLTITGVKKPLFKLSTGKYVSSGPLEQGVMTSPLVDYAVAVGVNQKFCGMLIVPQLDALQAIAQAAGIDSQSPHWWLHPALVAHYQALIVSANCHLPYWSTVRQFRLLDPHHTPRPSITNGGRRPDGQLHRPWVEAHLVAAIQDLYTDGATGAMAAVWSLQDSATPVACPNQAQSLLHH